jgi:AcrR family transcriptional regulator
MGGTMSERTTPGESAPTDSAMSRAAHGPTATEGVGSASATGSAYPDTGRPAMTTTKPEPTDNAERRRRGKTLAERRQERHDAILDAGLDLFGTKGYTNTTVEEICRAAYVSTRNFYEEFANREAVMIALGERVAAQGLEALMKAEVEPGLDRSVRQTRASIRALLDVLVADPRVARFAFIESLGVSPGQEMRRRRIHYMIAEWLADFTVEEGKAVGRTEERQILQALAVVGACNELISDWVLREDRGSIEDLTELLVEVVQDMLPAPRSTVT